MKEMIQYITTSLVDDPTQVKIEQYRHGSQTILKLHVAKEDMGRVIGRSGRVAVAMRALLRVAASQEGKRARLDIVEPE
jgi:predicted RNA-binding protein YlqC (UPF0109 family)